MNRSILLLSVLAAGISAGVLKADWPVYQHDANRTGTTQEALRPGAKAAWTFFSSRPPSPGFYAQVPEKKDQNIGQQQTITQTITADYAFAPVIAGGNLYFGSSSQDCVVCLDAKTGEKKWVFFAEGAVRFAPAYEQGKLYFGADDGRVYCLDAATGKLVWKFEAAPEERMVIANGKMASQWPVRTGVAVEKGKVFFSAGLFPATGGVYLYAVDAKTGALVWKKGILTPAQGYILAAEDLLFVPSGRSSPVEYRQADGTPLAAKSDMRRSGGSTFVGMFGDMVVYGPSEFGIFHFRTEKEGEDKGLDRIMHGQITGLEGWRVAKRGDMAYFLSDKQVMAINAEDFTKSLKESGANFATRVKDRTIRAKSGVQQGGDAQVMKEIEPATKWKAAVKGARSLLLAGDTVVVGGEGEVKGFDAASGSEKFVFPVEGVAWEMAASGGSLYVSTSSGRIYCFGQDAKVAGDIKESADAVYAGGDEAKFRALAEWAVKKAGRKKGFCVIAGVGDGRLAYEIAKASEMKVLCVEKNPEVAAKAQEKLVRAGVYGQVVVHVRADGKLPYVSHFANLVLSESSLSDGKTGFAAEAVYPMLQPYGGVMAFGGDEGALQKEFPMVEKWAKEQVGGFSVSFCERGALKGAGEWTHMFANAQNTANSGDWIVGGSDYLVQWFGDPSPIESTGWHYLGMGPLYKDGVLVNIKAFSAEAVDAYNGTSLWHHSVPESTRLNPGREGGSGCLDDKNFYFAVKNDCRVYGLVSGEKKATYLGPDEKSDWGFIAVQGEVLVGSKQNPGATSSAISKGKDSSGMAKNQWYATEAEYVVSTSVFGLNKETGAVLWNHANPDAVVLNNSIAIGEKEVYFVESRNPEVVKDSDGSVGLREFFAKDTFLVSKDLKTGKTIFEVPFQSKARSVFYLSVSGNLLVETASYHVGPYEDKRTALPMNHFVKELGDPDAMKKVKETVIRFDFRGLDAANGKEKWATGYTSDGYMGAQHNYNVNHPVITAKTLYHDPAEQYLVKVDMGSGALKENKGLQRAKGCTTPTGSERAMFFRSLGISGIDLEKEKQFYISDVSRSSCWMNVIPAGGLVMIPEYSFGCMCGFPLQTTIVLAPATLKTPVEVKREVSGTAGRGDDEEATGGGKGKKKQ